VRTVRLLVWLAGAAFCATMIIGAIRGGWPPAEKASFTYGAAFAEITLGLVVWHLRPESRTGILLTALPFAFLISDLNVVFRHSALAVTLGWGASWLAAPLVAQVALSYPSGRLTSRLDRALVVVGYVFAAVYGLFFMLFYDPRSWYNPDAWFCPTCGIPYTHVATWLNPAATDRVLSKALFVLATFFVVLLVRKIWRASPGGRRVVWPLAFAGCFVAVEFGVQMVLYGEPVNSWTHPTWFWIVGAAPLSIPVALAAGLLWGRGGHGAVAGLVVELERTPPGSVRDALARALGDPSLELALWLPERGAYVDGEGRPVALPSADSGRAVTTLGPVGAPVAALVHDPVLRERRGLLTAAGAAARLALENERLQAELRAQLAELHASRARIVTAGDDERRRLESYLQDGALQRLLGLGLALQLARGKLGPEANGADELLSEADTELRAALDELRELARGIHPAVLTEQGLAAALKTLAERSPVPVTIAEVPSERLPGPAEAAAYFLVSEALANVVKYARASGVRVSVVHTDERVLVDVDDDGVGGADPARGSGLRGLWDRVHALDGELELESSPGRGTHVHAEIPCA
jgi:signal transduction histidine kinase